MTAPLPATPAGVVLVPVPVDGPRAAPLLAEMRADVDARYGVATAGRPLGAQEFQPPDGLFLVAVLDGADVGCGGIRLLDDDRAELKRMYVRRAHVAGAWPGPCWPRWSGRPR